MAMLVITMAMTKEKYPDTRGPTAFPRSPQDPAIRIGATSTVPGQESWVLGKCHWIGLRENLQETMVFTIKYRAFL